MSDRMPPRLLPAALAVFATLGASLLLPAGSKDSRAAQAGFDPLLAEGGSVCGSPYDKGTMLRSLVLVAARSENTPFQTMPMQVATGGDVTLYRDLGQLGFKVSTRDARAQRFFDQGLRLAFGFNHAEAQRAFQAAQRFDPDCAMCYWGEALVLGPNINAPMAPEANAAALAALAKARALSEHATPRERALIAALGTRYADDASLERAALDAAYADAMQAVAKRFPRDDTLQTLYAEAAMDTQPWDYWEAAGTRPKGRAADFVAALETVLKRHPTHPGAIHLYIHAVEASDRPERALPFARKLGALMPGAGHIVHMPAHIYYRIGMFRESLATNQQAIAIDERYFTTSPSDPMYRMGYYPHNIHFALVSAMMGGDGATALAAATKLNTVLADEAVRQFPSLEPVKSALYSTHAMFSPPDTILALPAPATGLALVSAMHHYARAVAFAAKQDSDGARREIDTLAALESATDFKPYTAWQVPAREIMQTAQHVARARLAAAGGDLEAAAQAFEAAVALQDGLAYMEPPYWYYPVRQSLGAIRLRQGKLDEAEKAFRDSLGRVRNNGWALAGLAAVYRQQGKKASQASTEQALAKAWFGARGGPAPEQL